MKKVVLLLILVAMLASACAAQVERPTPTSETRPTVTPLGAAPRISQGTPTPPQPTFETSPVATPASTSPLPTPAVESPLSTPTAAAPRPTPGGETRTLVVLAHESFALSDAVLQRFEQENNATVQFIKQGDAGQALTRAILTKDNPEADVIFGVDNTLMSRALEAGILEPYQSGRLLFIPRDYQLDSTFQLVPIDYGDVCLNYDKAYFEQKKLPAAAADAGRSDKARIQGPARGRESRRFITRSGFHAGDRVGLRRRSLAGLLDRSQEERRESGGGLEYSVLHRIQRIERQRPAPDRGESTHPVRPPKSCSPIRRSIRRRPRRSRLPRPASAR